MKKLIASAVFILICFTQNSYGQQTDYWSAQYQVGFGSGDLGDYISAPSFRGALIEYRKAVKDNLLVGFDLGWSVFYDEVDAKTYTSGTETLYGKQYRTQNEVPLLLAGDYFFSTDNPFKPYIGFGLGVMYTERSTDIGQWRFEENPLHFTVKPEVGFLYEINSRVSFKLAAKYYYGVQSGDLDGAQAFFAISTGAAIHL